jgi:uncharacterized protein
MEHSRHNIFSAIHQSDEYFLVNILSGNADILSNAEAQRYLSNEVSGDPEYIEKGYVVDPVEEERLYRRKYLDFLDTRDNDEIQIFYVSSYACNFSCSYCYQEGYGQGGNENDPSVTAAFFSYIRSNFQNRRKYITLFGGEPLLGGTGNRKFLTDFVRQCHENNLDLAVVTNGYHLESYIDLLSGTHIRELQVTLDGPEKVHNNRRPLKGGRETFSSIVRGIDAALTAGLPVNLRVVIDLENIGSLPELAQYASDKGWTQSPLFKTQLGRNYELHYCQSQQSRLYSRIDLYKDLYNLIQDNPVILDFHKPAYSVSKFLFENGELPSPLFDSCPGCKTEWAFDYTGKIYSCTATVGKPDEELGTFYPQANLNGELVERWQQRDILSIKACGSCNLRLACGGGCASVAYNRDKDLHAPDCRPVKELLELGISLYLALQPESSGDE